MCACKGQVGGDVYKWADWYKNSLFSMANIEIHTNQNMKSEPGDKMQHSKVANCMNVAMCKL
jgi:hypothetical protein